MGLVTHIVALAYDQSASNAEKHLIASSFIALKDLCRLKAQEDGVEGENYIVDITGGAQNSPEPGPGQAYHHAFVLTFLNTEHRDYYLDHDPAHQAFKASLVQGGKVTGAFVFDFELGRFE